MLLFLEHRLASTLWLCLVNIAGFEDYLVSIATTQFLPPKWEAALDSVELKMKQCAVGQQGKLANPDLELCSVTYRWPRSHLKETCVLFSAMADSVAVNHYKHWGWVF